MKYAYRQLQYVQFLLSLIKIKIIKNMYSLLEIKYIH